MASFDEVGIALYVDRFEHAPERVGALFAELEEAMDRLGVGSNRLGASWENGESTGYKTYRGLRPSLLKTGFVDLKGFTLECLKPGRPKEGHKSWTSQAVVSMARSTKQIGMKVRRWKAHLIIFPEDAGVREHTVLEETMRFASMAMDEYGYIAWLKRGTEPAGYDIVMGVPGDMINQSWSHSRNQLWNKFTWTKFGCWTKRLLRDTYPINFLGRSYLDLPIEGVTLEKWILADPARGTLEPFNGRVWVWKPVIAQIPFIREPLFRAGLLHWWRMFSIDDYSQLQVTEPFVPPAETPEMFRPEYYSGRDPKVTN